MIDMNIQLNQSQNINGLTFNQNKNRNLNITNRSFLPKLEECKTSTQAAEQEAQIYDILFQEIIYKIMGLIKGFTVEGEEGEKINIFSSLIDENDNILSTFDMDQLYSRLQRHTFYLYANVEDTLTNNNFIYKIIKDDHNVIWIKMKTKDNTIEKQFQRKSYKISFIDTYNYFQKTPQIGGLGLSLDQINKKYSLKDYFENIEDPSLLTNIIEKDNFD